PLTCTTQAPHCVVSQPTCVPVRPSRSRRKSTSSVRPSTALWTAWPFTIIETSGIVSLLLFRVVESPHHHPQGRDGTHAWLPDRCACVRAPARPALGLTASAGPARRRARGRPRRLSPPPGSRRSWRLRQRP